MSCLVLSHFVAVSLALFGIDTAYITKLPGNDVGRAAVNSLRSFGVDTGRIVYGDGRMGLYYLEKGASQRSGKVVYDRAYSVITQAGREDFDWDALLEGVGWFHWMGITPALSEGLAGICMDACEAARKKGITVSCDLNYRKTLWAPEKAGAVMVPLMEYVDVCIANEEDADKVLGIRPEDNHVESGELNRAGYESVAKEICERYGCRYAAVTMRESYDASVNGWSAMLYSREKGRAYFSRRYEIRIVDRVGGGDSFAAGLIYGLLSGKEEQAALEFAAAASCLKHTIEGDYNRVSVVEVEALLENGGHGRVQR